MSGENIYIQTGEYVTLRFKKASCGNRILAVVLDWLFIFVLFIVALMSEIEILLYLLWFLYTGLNLFVEYFSKGRTLGKLVMGIKVINDQCTPPTFLQCFLRWLLFPIDFWLVGIILISNKGQRLGDLASGCQCIIAKDHSDVDLSREFKYTNRNYKVRFEKAGSLTPSTIDKIKKYTISKEYDLSRDQLIKSLKKELEVSSSLTDLDFLFQVYNDYKYINEVM